MFSFLYKNKTSNIFVGKLRLDGFISGQKIKRFKKAQVRILIEGNKCELIRFFYNQFSFFHWSCTCLHFLYIVNGQATVGKFLPLRRSLARSTVWRPIKLSNNVEVKNCFLFLFFQFKGWKQELRATDKPKMNSPPNKSI